MKLDVPKAIIIGSIIVAVTVIFNGWYERGLAYNTCVRMIKENPFNRANYDNPKFIKKYCEWNVIVKKGSDPEFNLQYSEAN
jgi:hypothetical protein|tara:strand:- start:565 stop:810 length:246 start_codon:yes stop_codon:yes gene_type:complete